ncbi:hypothetical protein ACFOQN_05250, partial [Neisseria musculi]
MYLIFNTYGHCEMAAHEAPALSGDQYCLEADFDDARPFAWSNGETVWFSDTPPPGHLHQLHNGKWVLPDDAAAQQLRAAKSAKLQQLNAAAQDYIDAAAETDKLPAFEVQTWPLQAVEVKVWAADNAAPTPVLDGIAAARGVPVEQLRAAALRKTLA